jgi:hypothetical protein
MKPWVLTYCSSDHEICSTFQVGGANSEDHDGGDDRGNDQVLRFGKEEREKQKTQGKDDIHKSSLFWRSRHIVGVIIFRLDDRNQEG